MSATIKFVSPKFHAGALKAVGDTLTTDAATAAMYVSEASAVYVEREALADDKGDPVFAKKSVTGRVRFSGDKKVAAALNPILQEIRRLFAGAEKTWPPQITASPSFTFTPQADYAPPSAWAPDVLNPFTSVKFMNDSGVVSEYVTVSLDQSVLKIGPQGGFNDGTSFNFIATNLPLYPDYLASQICYEFMTDAPLFGIAFCGSWSGLLYCDKEVIYVSQTKSGGPRWCGVIKHSTGRKMRKYRLVGNASYGIGGLFIGMEDTVAKAETSKLRWSIDGDSYMSNGGAYNVPSVIHGCVPASLGCVHAFYQPVGGTGYKNANGSYPNANDRLTNNIAAHGTAGPDIQVVSLGINDTKDATSKPFVESWFASFRAASPDSLLVVVSPWAPSDNVKGQLLASVYQYVKNCVLADQGLWVYIDAITGEWQTSWGTAGSVGRAWMTGTGRSMTLTAAPNNATSATMTSAWPDATGTYSISFDSGASRTNVTLTNGSTAVSWTGAITESSTYMGVWSVRGNTARIIGPDGTHAHAAGGDYLAGLFNEAFREAVCS